MKIPEQTPWGATEFSSVLREGVAKITTYSHGGLYVCPELNELVPHSIKADTFGQLGLEGWYEEDYDAAVLLKYLDANKDLWVIAGVPPLDVSCIEAGTITPEFAELLRRTITDLRVENEARQKAYRAIADLNRDLVTTIETLKIRLKEGTGGQDIAKS